MSDTSSSSSGGIGFAGLLTIVFIVMKLMAYGPVGNWSWWMVFCPIWGSAAIVLAILLLVLYGLCDRVIGLFVIKWFR